MCSVAQSCLSAPWTVASQAPLSTEFSRQEYWSGLPFPPPQDLPDQGSSLCLLHWRADSLPLRQLEAHIIHNVLIFNMTAILPHTWQVILKCLLSLLLSASRLTFTRPVSVPLPDSFLCQRLLCPPCPRLCQRVTLPALHPLASPQIPWEASARCGFSSLWGTLEHPDSRSCLLFVCMLSCPTLCNSMDYSPPGPSVHGIFPAVTVELVARPSSRGSSQSRDQTHISCIIGRFFTAELPGKPYLLFRSKVLDWSKMSFRFFCKMLQKNPNELFGNPVLSDCLALHQLLFSPKGSE